MKGTCLSLTRVPLLLDGNWGVGVGDEAESGEVEEAGTELDATTAAAEEEEDLPTPAEAEAPTEMAAEALGAEEEATVEAL